MEAPGGDEARGILDVGSKPDLAVIDLNIPPAGGGEVMRWLLEQLPSLRVVITSGAELSPELRGELVGAGGSFLRKPFSPRTLSAMVQRTLAGESHPDGLG